jgi:AcrR family transcriptional regulator
VTLDDIVRAALKIGLEQATIRSVADALGMSVPGLYHHVRTREQLLDLVAEWWLGQLLSKAKTGESFEALLQRYARKLFEMTADHPQMIERIQSGSAMATNFYVAPYLEQILAHGVKCGFAPKEAFDIFTTVTGAALGAAVVDVLTHAIRPAGALPPAGADVSEPTRLVRESIAEAYLTVEATFAGLRAIHGDRLQSAPSDA